MKNIIKNTQTLSVSFLYVSKFEMISKIYFSTIYPKSMQRKVEQFLSHFMVCSDWNLQNHNYGQKDPTNKHPRQI